MIPLWLRGNRIPGRNGKKAAWLGRKSFRASPQAGNTIELLNGKGNIIGSLKMLSNVGIQSPSGWKLRRMNP